MKWRIEGSKGRREGRDVGKGRREDRVAGEDEVEDLVAHAARQLAPVSSHYVQPLLLLGLFVRVSVHCTSIGGRERFLSTPWQWVKGRKA